MRGKPGLQVVSDAGVEMRGIHQTLQDLNKLHQESASAKRPARQPSYLTDAAAPFACQMASEPKPFCRRRLVGLGICEGYCYTLAMSFLLKGFILGFSIAAPIGPIGVLCIRRTLAEGKTSGFVSGLGAATADAVYGLIAAFGLATVSTFLLSYQRPIRVVGGLFLFYLATKIALSRPAKEAANAEVAVSLWKSYASTAFLTLTNPATIVSFIAVFSGLGLLSSRRGYLGPSSMVFGVFLGSTLWWLILSTGTAFFGRNLDTPKLVWINRSSGLVIASLGIWSLWGS